MSQEHVTFRITKRALFGMGCMALGALLGTATIALADGDNSTQTVLGSDLIMPYDGYLMIDAAPITGVRTIKFDLYQDATGGTAVWTETQTVNLYNGRFSVGLGSASSLTSTLLDAEKLYLAMTVVETDAQGNSIEIALSGRQAIEPAPFAAWAANAADFNVSGDLTVAKDVRIEGDELEFGTSGQRALYHNPSDQLYISPSRGFTGGVFVGNDFQVNYATQLGDAGGAYTTTIYGPDSNGSSQSALQIKKSDGATMFLDDNEIDSSAARLALNVNSQNGVQLTGPDNSGSTAALIINSADASSPGQLLLDNNEIDNTSGLLGINANTKNGVNIGGNLNLDGRILPDYENWDGTQTGSGGAVITNDNNTFKALMIVGNDSAVNGTGNAGDRRVNLYDDVSISGDLTVAGDITNFTVAQYTDKSSQTTLAASAQSICFISKMYLKGYNEASDFAECGITNNGTNWILSFNRDEVTITCSATCLSW